MSLSSTAVRRPVATAMVYVALTVIGVFAFQRLQVDLFPELDFLSISIVTTYDGVGPAEIESLITRPVEAAVARIEGIDEIDSYSSEGRSRVALRFDWGVDLKVATDDVRAALDRIRAQIPEDADTPIVYKFDLASFPVMYLSLGGSMDEARIRRFAEDVAQPLLERVSGVAAVDIRGARDREIRVEIDPERLASLGIGVQDVVAALRTQNLIVPAGLVEDGAENVLLRAMGEFDDLEQIARAVVARRGPTNVRVEDVADVVDGMEELRNIVRLNGEYGVRLSVTKSADANTIDVSDGVLEVIERFNEDYEGIANLEVIVDTSTFIRRSITSVQQAVLIGAVLALFVLLFFLQSVRSTLVIGIAIPISVIATFILMYELDLTLNLISFGGLALGIGMLVDNAIVILENIFRHREEGVGRKEAAIEGSREVAAAITASTMTTLAVFVPVIFLGGFAAVFFQQMALVVTSALICSLFIALTLVPVLSSVLLPAGAMRPSGIGLPIRAALDALDLLYSRVVSSALRHPLIVISISVATLAASLTFADEIGRELMPESDESEVRVSVDFPNGTRIEMTEAAIARLEEAIWQNVPEATTVMSTLGNPGFWSTRGEESGSIRINLVPVEERERSSDEVARALRPILEQLVPGLDVRVRSGGGLWIFNFIRGGEDRISVEIRGYDLEVTDRIARDVAEIAEQLDGISDARPSRREGGRELQVYVDRVRAAELGLSTGDVARTVSTLVQGTTAGVFRDEGDEFPIRVRLQEAGLQEAQTVLTAPISLPSGGVVPLEDVVRVDEGRTPLAIDRVNQERIVTVSAGLSAGQDLGSVIDELRGELRKYPVPEGYSVIVAGESAEQEETFSTLLMGMLLAILLVYMVMAGQFESFVYPVVIMVAVPFAAIGVIATLLLTDTTLNINSFMGIIVLVGVVVNNAIVLIDYINLLRRERGYDLDEGIVEASRRRLRPILMTTATTVLAMLPVAIGSGTGGEAQAPLARVVVGGLLSSTVLTLILVPVLYRIASRARDRVLGWFGASAP